MDSWTSFRLHRDLAALISRTHSTRPDLPNPDVMLTGCLCDAFTLDNITSTALIKAGLSVKESFLARVSTFQSKRYVFVLQGC
jgi:hypothetical protein